MIKINGLQFTEKPSSCGTCPFFNCGATSTCSGSDKGVCVLFNEEHKRWINTPPRCKKLFNKAFKFKQGTELVITAENL